MQIPGQMLAKLYDDFSTNAVGNYRKQVSETNPFVIEYYRTDKLLWGPSRTEPNWALIIPLAIVLLAVIVAVIAISIHLYRSWRQKNYCPIYFAGEVKYVPVGQNLNQSVGNYCWLSQGRAKINARGMEVLGLYTDATFQTPFTEFTVINQPTYIFPKLK